MRVRRARLDEAGILLGMEREEIGTFSLKQLSSFLTSGAVALVAEEEGDLKGFVLALIKEREDARVYILTVRQDARRRGVGMLLMGALEEELRRLGIRRCHLEVRASNLAARQLYSKLWYEEVGLLKNYYGGEDGMKMAKGL